MSENDSNEETAAATRPGCIILSGRQGRTLVPLREVKLVREEPGRVTIDLISGGFVGIDGGEAERVLDLVADMLRGASS